MLHQPQILNSLIEQSKKQQKLTNIKPLINQQHQQHQQNANLSIQTTKLSNEKMSKNLDSQWHWQHYHLPYKFGLKTPNFHDYDENDFITTANDTFTDNKTNDDLFPTKLFNNNDYNLSTNLITSTDNKLSKLSFKNYDHLAHLSCDSGEMILRLNFSEPFKGIVYPDHDRLSPCRFFGDGHYNYELRLPLRGCGTRQAAPRFFVNDVIVRFHKTLELEEDEVKTLICRYPPPLAPVIPSSTGETLPQPATSGSSSSSNGNSNLSGSLFKQVSPPLHSFNGNIDSILSNRHSNYNNNNLEQENSSTPSFELVDNVSGRPRKHQQINLSGGGGGGGGGSGSHEDSPGGGGSTSGNIDTFSENLVVAPSSDLNLNNQKTPLQKLQDYYGANNNDNNGRNNNLSIKNNNNNIKPINLITADLFNSRNSNSGFSSTMDNANQQRENSSLSTFFDRLTGIELLFLISSIMFLILLILGLIGSYYCFKRNRELRSRRRRVVGGGVAGLMQQTNNHHHHQRASAILKRKPIHYSSPSSLIAAKHNQANILHHHYNHLPPPTMIGPPLPVLQHINSNQQHKNMNFNPNNYQHQRILTNFNTTPSSPESNISARNHLLTTSSSSSSSSSSAVDNNNNNQQQQQQQQQHYAIFSNRAFVPDADQQHYFHTTATQIPAPTSFGGRSQQQQHLHYATTNRYPYHHHHQQQQQQQQQPHFMSNNQQSLNRINKQQFPILGRRETIYSSYLPSQVSNRNQHFNNNNNNINNNAKLLRVAYSEDPLINSISTQTITKEMPLLSLTPNNNEEFFESNNQLMQNQKLFKFNQRQRDQDQLRYNNNNLYRAEHIYLGPANNKISPSNKKSMQTQKIFSNSFYNNDNKLSRAKSLSSVNQNVGIDDHNNHHHDQQVYNNNNLIGGTLLRHEQQAKKGLKEHLRRQQFENNNNITQKEVKGEEEVKKSKKNIDYLLRSNDNKLQDCDSGEDDNNNETENERQQQHKPKILLKSIEDSYITNLTEIYEQEYVKKDSTKFISMSEWRQLQPETPEKNSTIKRRKNFDADEEFRNSTSSEESDFNQDEDDDDDGGTSKSYLKGRNNLRSLTELDVNFAKSSLIINNQSENNPSTSSLTIRRNDDSQSNSDDDVVDEKKMDRVFNKNNSMPDGVDEQNNRQQLVKLNQENDNNRRIVLTSPESPDLILSPEYDHGQQQRLELIDPSGSISSHNSVSYV